MDAENLCNLKYLENTNFLWWLSIEFHQVSFHTIKFKVREVVWIVFFFWNFILSEYLLESWLHHLFLLVWVSALESVSFCFCVTQLSSQSLLILGGHVYLGMMALGPSEWYKHSPKDTGIGEIEMAHLLPLSDLCNLPLIVTFIGYGQTVKSAFFSGAAFPSCRTLSVPTSPLHSPLTLKNWLLGKD